MTVIALPRKMVCTPSSILRIDWSNPITRGLVYCVIGDMVIDLASGKLSSRSVTNGTITNRVTTAGVGLMFSGANSVKASRKILGNGDASILLVADPASESASRTLTMQTGGVGLLKLISNSDQSGGDGVPGQMCWLWLQSGVERSAILVPSVIDGKLHTHVITKSAGAASAFVDGAKKSISIFGSLSNSLTSAADIYQVGGDDQSGSNSPNCTINANFVWSRKISDGEAAAVSANPWQIFAPRETRLFVPVSTGGPTAYALDSQPGSVAVTGSASTLQASRKLSANPGTVSIVGASATCKVSRKLNAAAGAVTIAGATAELVYTPVGASPVLNAEAGNVTIAGAVATLKSSRKLAADAGSITIVGATATMVRYLAGRSLDAQPGSITITGADAGYHRQYKIDASPFDVTIAGASASLVYTAAAGVMTLTQADLDAVVAAVIAALNATAIPVNVQKMNSAAVIGDGTEAQPWRGFGVSP